MKNFGAEKNWHLVKTAGKDSNRDDVGARVTLVTGSFRQMDELGSGGSYIPQMEK